VAVGAAAADTGDERDVRDETVHRAEHGRPQPATGDVGVVVVLLVLGELCRARVLHHFSSVTAINRPGWTMVRLSSPVGLPARRMLPTSPVRKHVRAPLPEVPGSVQLG
jgi:hypothetical protein